MKKDYTQWHKLKSYIEEYNEPILFREREIWWCSLGLNIGDEEDGKNEYFERPILILRKFNKEIFWGLPMSTKTKDDIFHFNYSFDNNEKSSILLSQLRIISSKRLIRRLITINENTFCEIRNSVDRLIKNESDPIKGSSGA